MISLYQHVSIEYFFEAVKQTIHNTVCEKVCGQTNVYLVFKGFKLLLYCFRYSFVSFVIMFYDLLVFVLISVQGKYIFFSISF